MYAIGLPAAPPKRQAPSADEIKLAKENVGAPVAVPAKFFGVTVKDAYYLGRVHSVVPQKSHLNWLSYDQKVWPGYFNHVTASQAAAWTRSDRTNLSTGHRRAHI